MSNVHATPVHPHLAGICTWNHYSHGVPLECQDRSLPGGDLCADHYIAAVQAVPARPYRRWFGAA